jgi:hypothetical protein
VRGARGCARGARTSMAAAVYAADEAWGDHVRSAMMGGGRGEGEGGGEALHSHLWLRLACTFEWRPGWQWWGGQGGHSAPSPPRSLHQPRARADQLRTDAELPHLDGDQRHHLIATDIRGMIGERES